MLAELSIYPLGVGAHTSSTLADILQIVDLSRIPYVLTPSGTCIEGEWEEIMTLVKKCHEKARSHCEHVVTELRIEDDPRSKNKLRENIVSVEVAAGHRFHDDLSQLQDKKARDEVDEMC
jgi:uncharacterized protein (TIGR00106 family)